MGNGFQAISLAMGISGFCTVEVVIPIHSPCGIVVIGRYPVEPVYFDGFQPVCGIITISDTFVARVECTVEVVIPIHSPCGIVVIGRYPVEPVYFDDFQPVCGIITIK